MLMNYIFGVNHAIQHDGYLENRPKHTIDEIRGFREEIYTFARDHNIDMIAEEFCTDACQISNVETSILYRLAQDMEIGHLYLALNQSERVALGIASREHDVHEYEWLNKIRNMSYNNAIIVVGEDHVESFKYKLESVGCHCQVVRRGIGQNI